MAKLHERVDGGWSLVETQRHLLFASDAWVGNAVLEDESPYHPWGFPAGGIPTDAAAKPGLTLEATPRDQDEEMRLYVAWSPPLRRVAGLGVPGLH